MQNIEKKAVIATLLLIFLLSVIYGRGLYGDGSSFLMQILSSGSMLYFDKPRLHAVIFTQFPVLIALNYGYTDLNGLIRLHSASLIGPTLVAWIMALVIQYRSRYFWDFVLLISVSFLSAGFFPVGEYNITYSMVALCLAILLKDNLRPVELLVLLFISLILVRSYEAMVFLGPMLFCLAIHKSNDQKYFRHRWVQYGLFVLAFAFASAFAIAGWSIMYPRDPGNLSGAAGSIYLVKSKVFIFTFLMVGIYSLLHFRFSTRLKLLLTVFAFAISCIFLFNAKSWLPAAHHYAYRSLAGGAMFGICCLLFLLRSKKNENHAESKYWNAIAACFFFSLALHFLVTTLHYRDWMRNFELAANNVSAWVPIDQVSTIKDDAFLWDWSNPSMSIVLRGDHKSGIANRSDYKGWQPFEPHELTDNPLARYQKQSRFFE
jgi:hypothetical protein